MEDFRSTEIESDLGDSITWVVLKITQSISWHIYYGDWTLLAAGLNYLGFQSSSGVHHSVGDFRSTEIERDLGDSVTWVVLTITRSISWHIY